MNNLWIPGVALLTVILVSLFRKCAAETVPVLILVGGGVLLAGILPLVGSILETVRAIGSGAGLEDGAMDVVFRGLGICLISRFAADFCVDCGLRSLGETVEYCGRVATVFLALPMITELVRRISDGMG